MDKVIWTIGHWNIPEDEFISLLFNHNITTLVDVRSLPGSRRSPWFVQEKMVDWLSDAGVDYVHMPLLGGRRKAQSPIDPQMNAGWDNPSFRNYADYTLTSDWEWGLTDLQMLAKLSNVAIMCGEPMPWRCHRSLISNVLTARGWSVIHIISGSDKIFIHELGSWGPHPIVSEVGVVTYPLDIDD